MGMEEAVGIGEKFDTALIDIVPVKSPLPHFSSWSVTLL